MLIAFRSWLVSWPGIIASDMDPPRMQYIHDPLPKRGYTYLDFFLITTRNLKKTGYINYSTSFEMSTLFSDDT